MMTTKTHNYECCMCGDHGLSYELFRCKVCHVRSQHRYCSNLYPKAELYRVCNWCLIQKNDDHHTFTTTINSPSSRDRHHHHQTPTNKIATTKKLPTGPKIGGIGSKSLQPISPIKKQATRSPEAVKSPSGRKRISGPAQAQDKLRRTKSEEISNNNNNSSSSSPSSGGGGGGGPAVIKHVFRNKVRRYKLLEEVSS
ncbi:Beta-N-acetylhexosaminidase [Bienertia sinuspersici]